VGLGFNGGTLTCNANCTFNTLACVNGGGGGGGGGGGSSVTTTGVNISGRAYPGSKVTILKDFLDTRVEVKIENKGGKEFGLFVFVRDKQTQQIIKDLRVTLLKDDLELESYLSRCDKVIFEHVLAGKYVVEISNTSGKIASILLDIRR